MSPSSTADIVSPTSRALSSAPTLPTIAEDENFSPLSTALSSRREHAPASIDLPVAPAMNFNNLPNRKSSVTFTTNDGHLVEEYSVTPPRDGLSPNPPNNRMLAGHTPVRAPQRPPTPPPQKMTMDGVEDTPTRHNTHLNSYLTQSNDEDEDRELKGPLMLPELPHRPGDSNFTLDALSKKLEHIQHHPEDSKPLVFSQPSPGLASPVDERADELSPHSKGR